MRLSSVSACARDSSAWALSRALVLPRGAPRAPSWSSASRRSWMLCCPACSAAVAQQLLLLPQELLVRLAQLAQRADRLLVLAREDRVRLLEPLVLPGEPDAGVLAVHAREGALEGGVGRHDQPHVAGGHRLEVLGDPPVGRIGESDRRDVVDPRDREDPVLLGEGLRHERREAAVDGEPVEVDEGDVELACTAPA